MPTEDRVFSYTPREHFVPFHQRDQRWSCIVAHRRSGKTVSAVNDLILRALYSEKKNARYGYVAPFYSQAKDVAWTYLKEAAQPFVPSLKDIRESELRVRLINSSWVTLYGADNPDALRGKYFDGLCLDEFGDCRPSLWGEVLLPTLADRKGFGHFIGTPKGRNHFYDVHKRAMADPAWYSLTLKASDSGLLLPSELTEIKGQMSDEQYAQEMECDFSAAVRGTYYTALLNKLETEQQIAHGACKYEPEHPVYVASDLGYTDSTAMWFWQPRPDGIAIIDYLEAHGAPLEYYFDQLKAKPYKYEIIWLPHDARAKTLQTGRSTVEQFIQAGFPIQIAPNLKIQHGIDAARMVLPNCWIDLTRCADGVESLRAYRRKYNEVTKAFTDAPYHDWSSHGADAFRYLSLVCRDKMPKVAKKPRQTVLIPKVGYSLDELYKDQPGKSRFNKLRI